MLNLKYSDLHNIQKVYSELKIDLGKDNNFKLAYPVKEELFMTGEAKLMQKYNNMISSPKK